MGLKIKLLGLLKIEEENGAASEIMKWHKACALLAYLVVTGRPQLRQFLADLLWDAPSTSQSLQNLRKLLSRMRKWLPELEVTRKQVAYPVETAVSIDYLSLSTVLSSGGTMGRFWSKWTKLYANIYSWPFSHKDPHQTDKTKNSS